MTRTSFLGKCKSDGGYIFVATLLFLVAAAGFFGVFIGLERVRMRATERKCERFYQQLEKNNSEMQAEAKNEII